MKRINIIIVFLLFFKIVASQEKEAVKDGYQIFRYPNGTISSEGLFKNGKPEGFWKSYYVTGIKKSEGKRTNFLLDSIWIFYDQVGDTTCLLYTSDAADEEDSVDLGGRRIIK